MTGFVRKSSCLILMDELVAYAKVLFGAEGLPAGSFDNFITFSQQITEAARASENSIVVASIPESSIEIGGEAGQKALEAIEHTFGRMESIWKPVAANEGFEVVRRRLFLDCKDEAARDAVCDAFSQMYQDNSEDFPLESKEVEYRDRLVSCYPIHPEVFDRLYGDWATLERFQRTRGVLRLMAENEADYYQKYEALFKRITSGILFLKIPTLGKVFKLVYSKQSNLTKLNKKSSIFALNFVEPNPTDNLLLRLSWVNIVCTR